jgi:hypothetical protein
MQQCIQMPQFVRYSESLSTLAGKSSPNLSAASHSGTSIFFLPSPNVPSKCTMDKARFPKL